MKILKIVGIVVGVIGLAFAGLATYAYFAYFNIEGDYVANFIAKNPTKSALYWVRNDSLMAQQSPDRKMPLASTVKTIIAIEFAKQVSSGKLNPSDGVPLGELARFYIPNTDGGAHPAWLKHLIEKNLVKNGRVPLLEVAKGMIRFSSNANTEYLMGRLGQDAINANLSALNLAKHDSLYPFVSALYVCSEAGSAQELQAMSLGSYKLKAGEYFKALQGDTTAKATFDAARLSMPVQRVWSDRLPGSTARTYDGIMQKIQNRTYFDSTAQGTLEKIMEWPMEAFDSKRQKYQHLGAKGGSTAFVLTYALYATDKKGNKTRLTFLFNDLTTVESTLLQAQLADFQQKVLSDNEETREDIVKTLLTIKAD